MDSIDERHRHRYEVNPKYIEEYEKAGMKFVGRSDDNERMEILELENHPYFVGVQYHPEYISRPLKPSAPYLGLIWVLIFISFYMILFIFYYRLLVVN
jgi:CTP synthase